ncbi:Rho GTPase-activating protein [Lecanora helva]
MDQRNSLERSSSEAAAVAPPSATSIPNAAGSNGGNVAPMAPSSYSSPPVQEHSPVVESVLQSDIGVNTLLTRLKQSIASAREFAAFLKKRSILEEEQAQGLKKLCKSSHDSARRPDNRQGAYAQSYDEVIRIHDRMADNGLQFALSLHQMHEDLHDLSANMERGRKQWKQTGLSAEKRVQDSESMMEKAKSKYDSLAEDYERARTGDKQSGRVFGLKGPKSAAQHEEDLHRKVQQADSDYQTKVQAAKSQRQELVSTLRPQATKALHDLINECDAALTLQLQKFASFNERLLLGNGLCVSPLKSQTNDQAPRSLRDVIFQIDNARDLHNYVSGFASKVGASADIKYEPHPTLASSQQAPPPPINTRAQPVSNQQPSTFPSPGQVGPPGPGFIGGQIYPPTSTPTSAYPSNPGFSNTQNGSPQNQTFSPISAGGAPQLPAAQTSTPSYSQPPTPMAMHTHHTNNSHISLPALRPMFGISLEDLLKRDGSAIPLVVYQCIQAVDLFGLEVEGIYRMSGSSTHVSKLKSIFDNDPNQLDFRNPEAFYHDANSVAGLLKQFFRELPDPLLTGEHYQDFIDAARIDDDITRRDSMHATINSLPDPNYATLRALTLHLNRVQDHSAVNRMNAGNLAIIFGPTLMGTGPNVADAGWQVRAIDTILQNTYQIFDDD